MIDLRNRLWIFDGAMGTMLQNKGLPVGAVPETWNLSNREAVIDIHTAYLTAGCDILSANTFGANSLKFDDETLDAVIKAALENAREAISRVGKEGHYIALDIGPTGKLLKPYGDLDFEDAVQIFKKTATLGEQYGADLVLVETMNDLYEAKAALLAVKEATNLPVIVSCAFSENGKLMTGASPTEVVYTLEGLGADAIGVNCSFGPAALGKVADEMYKVASCPILFMPNAGLPKMENGKTVYDIDEETFATEIALVVAHGARIIGGCCGTTPQHIACLKEAVKGIVLYPVPDNKATCVCSGQKSVIIGEVPCIIGERINPTGKKRFKQALVEKDIAYILEEGIRQEAQGAHILDVNVGIPDIDEVSLMPEVVEELQAVVDLPLQIDTSNPTAMERALRRYNGKALINSVNGKRESMDAVFPLLKKYGGVAVCLTLDEDGIPATAEGRLQIAERILTRASEYGIDPRDLIFDTLCMTISTDKTAAETTVGALKMIHEKHGAHTVLGISNVSFGLPDREAVNARFLTYALESGLSCAIINPHSAPVMDAFFAFVGGNRTSGENISDFAERVINASLSVAADIGDGIQNYVLHGQKIAAANAVREMLTSVAPLDIVNNEIIPALDIVGKLYEDGKVFLPQLLMSAEAAKSAFEVIKETLSASSDASKKRSKFVIATVHGDIHDIGKNIVKLLLENYGFDVIDLGKDVPEETIVDCVVKEEAGILGLSALMTTTVPAMERTIALLRERAPHCRVVVGGAVLNEEYAAKMGADQYARDALATVRFAEEVYKEL